jgi:type III pantothenate kinase
MLAVIDTGNTNTVFGIYDGVTLKASFRLASRRDATVDEWLMSIDGMLAFRAIDRANIDAVCIASVVPSLGSLLEDVSRVLFGVEPLVVGPGIRTGISISYESPADVGPDRIVNAVAAHARYRMNTIVIDLGTATTFDAVTGSGHYLGGVIVPGIAMGLDALSARTARLPRAGFARTEQVIGRNTVASIQSGAYWGLVSMLEGLTARMKLEFDGPVKVVATGGLAGLICRECPFIDEVDGNLTMEGLRLIWEKNRGAFVHGEVALLPE